MRDISTYGQSKFLCLSKLLKTSLTSHPSPQSRRSSKTGNKPPVSYYQYAISLKLKILYGDFGRGHSIIPCNFIGSLARGSQIAREAKQEASDGSSARRFNASQKRQADLKDYMIPQSAYDPYTILGSLSFMWCVRDG